MHVVRMPRRNSRAGSAKPVDFKLAELSLGPIIARRRRAAHDTLFVLRHDRSRNAASQQSQSLLQLGISKLCTE
jgi:hypothetical protein